MTDARIMPGLSSWMRSHEKPMRSSAPGAKFSTSTSDSLISFSSTSLPSGVLVSSVSDFLLLLSIVKYSASTPGMSRSWERVTSPEPGRSTLTTSAPNQASSWVQAGPACTWVKSMILMPLSGVVMVFPFCRGVRRVRFSAACSAKRRWSPHGIGQLSIVFRPKIRVAIRLVRVDSAEAFYAFPRLFFGWLTMSGRCRQCGGSMSLFFLIEK